ncbi:hypothetical protein [Ferrimonas sp.]|uniref:hypothetical protein n=1 Tax=Ferrimonas sp. TaxID=2080861 RepID=UPI003A913AEE
MTKTYLRDLIDTFPMGLSNAGHPMTRPELERAYETACDARENIALSIQTLGELVEHAGMGDAPEGLPPALCLNVGSLMRILGELSQGVGDAGDNLAHLIKQRGGRV